MHNHGRPKSLGYRMGSRTSKDWHLVGLSYRSWFETNLYTIFKSIFESNCFMVGRLSHAVRLDKHGIVAYCFHFRADSAPGPVTWTPMYTTLATTLIKF